MGKTVVVAIISSRDREAGQCVWCEAGGCWFVGGRVVCVWRNRRLSSKLRSCQAEG